MFEDANPNELKLPLSHDWPRSSGLVFPEEKWRSPTKFRTMTASLSFKGTSNRLEYGYYKTGESFSVEYERPNGRLDTYDFYATKRVMPKRYVRESKVFTTDYCLTISILNFEDKVNTRLVQEHYDSYYGDFGLQRDQNINDSKNYYSIPLFKSGNVHYVRANIGGITRNMYLDTGASYLLISKSLYRELKNNGNVDDLNVQDNIVMANGSVYTLIKVMIKGFSISDLKLNYIEAYVNIDEEISLLGQNFLSRFGSISIDYNDNLLIIKK